MAYVSSLMIQFQSVVATPIVIRIQSAYRIGFGANPHNPLTCA